MLHIELKVDFIAKEKIKLSGETKQQQQQKPFQRGAA